MRSLRKNYFYSVLLVMANYVFPFLTYPYVSRVLGVTGIGACNFVDSIINYFILFSTLGIETLGVREIAKHSGDKESLNRTFSNIFVVNLSLTGVMLALLFVATAVVPQLSAHKDLMYIGAFKLVFNCLLMDWMFKGLEDFQLITRRTIILKTLYVAAVFLFVRQRGDVWVYYLLSSLLVVCNAIVNMLLARRRVRLTLRGLRFFSTFKSLLALGVYAILTSMYTTFNVSFLGFISGEEEVGFYTTATKICYLILAVFTAFTDVMLPHMSSLVSSGDMDRFKDRFRMAVDFILALSLPIVIWLAFMAPDVVQVIAGSEFGGAVLPLRIIAPLIFIIAFEQILVLQTLLPLGRDKLLLRNSAIGAALGLALNVALVPVLAAIGSSIVWLCIELLILVLSQRAVRNIIEIEFPYLKLLKNLAVCIPLAIVFVACLSMSASSLVKVLVTMAIAGVYILVYQMIIKKGALLKALR